MAGASAAVASRPNKELESKLRKIHWVTDDLRKQVFEASHRGHQLANSMGFDSIEEAEETIASHPEIFNRGFMGDVAERVQQLCDELQKSQETNRVAFAALEEAREAAKEVQEENVKLREELEKLRIGRMSIKLEPGAPAASGEIAEETSFITGLQTPVTVVKPRPLRDVTPGNARVLLSHLDDAPSSDLASTPTKRSGESSHSVSLQLQQLRDRYDALLEAKHRSDAKHHEDFERWRKFKGWLAELVLESPSKRKANYRKKLVQIAQFLKLHGPRLSEDREMKPAVEVKAEEGVDKSSSEMLPPSSPPLVFMPKRKRKFDETSSDTEDDSQAPSPVMKTQPGLHAVSPGGSSRKRIKSPRSPKRVSAKQPRMSLDESTTRTPHKSVALAAEVTLSHEAANATSSAASPPRHASKFFNSSTTPILNIPKGKGKENAPAQSSSKREDDYSIYKGRGRYGDSAEKNATINALYQIDPSHNAGRNFQFDEVVRSKEQRKHLTAGDCECCRDYYEAVGPLPPRPQAPLWRSPQSTPPKLRTRPCLHSNKHSAKVLQAPSDANADLDTDKPEEQAIVEHRHQISRHRHQWERAKTPPGYWNIGFPTTQEAAVINAKAEQMHEEKRRRVDLEARQGGKYKRR